MRLVSQEIDCGVEVRVYDHPIVGELMTSTCGSLVLVRHFFRVTARDLAEARQKEKRKARSSLRAKRVPPQIAQSEDFGRRQKELAL